MKNPGFVFRKSLYLYLQMRMPPNAIQERIRPEKIRTKNQRFFGTPMRNFQVEILVLTQQNIKELGLESVNGFTCYLFA